MYRIPNRIFVGGIPKNASQIELKEYFSNFGLVKDARIITDSQGVSKGYGFVTYEDENDASRVLGVGDSKLVFKEQKLNVGHAFRKKNGNGMNGGGNGGGYGGGGYGGGNNGYNNHHSNYYDHQGGGGSGGMGGGSHSGGGGGGYHGGHNSHHSNSNHHHQQQMHHQQQQQHQMYHQQHHGGPGGGNGMNMNL